MGYETKLIIGKEVCRSEKNGVTQVYFENYLTIDLCKLGSCSDLHEIHKPNKNHDIIWYFYGFDRDERIVEDNYGCRFLPISIDIVIEAIEKDLEKMYYRRFKWALALLESMIEDEKELKVIFYGH